MSMAGIRDAIKTAMATVTALKATFDTVPDNVGEWPVAWVSPLTGSYHEVFDPSKMTHQMEVTCLVSRGGSVSEAQDTMDALLDPGGDADASLFAALEATALSTHGDYINVLGYRDYGGPDVQ